MKKHLGWMIRLLIAALGVGYILSTLSWSDQVWLPPGYVPDPPLSVRGGEAGRAYAIIDESETAYWIGIPPDAEGTGPDWAELAKSDLGTTDDKPQFRPAFLTILSQADATQLVLGGLLFIPVVMLASLRWWVLMRARGIAIAYTRVGRLVLTGYFFNLCMPGTTGGDVMKAYYAAKGTHQRADAVVSIAIDRLCGLLGLIVLVGLLGLFSLDDPLIRKLTIAMWCGFAGLFVGGWVYTSPALRARLKLSTRLGKLPGKLPGAGAIRSVDAWVTAYRRHLDALGIGIGLSLFTHFGAACAMTLAGFALGVDQPLLYLVSTIPVVLMLWALPVSGPLGLGPLDYVAVQLIIGGGETTAQRVAMMFIAFRLYLIAAGLVGAVALLGIEGRKR